MSCYHVRESIEKVIEAINKIALREPHPGDVRQEAFKLLDEARFTLDSCNHQSTDTYDD